GPKPEALIYPAPRPLYPGGLNRSTQHFILKKGWSVVMGQRFHRGFTAAEKTELWDRWKRGEPLKAIGRAFGSRRRRFIFWWRRMVGFVLPSGGAPGWH